MYTKRRSTRWKSTEVDCTVPNEKGRNFSITFRTPSDSKDTSFMNFWPTANSACLGQGWNQSITVLPTSAGNFLFRLRKSSPTGLKHMMTWRFFLISLMKKFQSALRSKGMPKPLAREVTPLMQPSISSGAKRSGISPDARRSLM